MIEERGRLSGLLANSKSFETERANSTAEITNRLNSQIAKLESELVALRKKLDIQTEDVKNISLLKETEAQNYLKRIEQLTTDLVAVRQSLARACDDHEKFKAAHDLVKTHLASAQEKLKALRLLLFQIPNHASLFLHSKSTPLRRSSNLFKLSLIFPRRI